MDDLVEGKGSCHSRSSTPHGTIPIEALPDGELIRRHQAAERALLNTGITFTVYGDEQGTERIFPFDVVPRIVPGATWDPFERGLKQRIEALNLFLDDIYHDQRIVRDGVVPAFVIESSQGFRPQCVGLDPPGGVWCHITGTDLVRHRDGTVYVLEDNLRCPSGVSYVLENRAVMQETLPAVFEGLGVRPVNDYPSRLLTLLEEVAPQAAARPRGLSRAVLNFASGSSPFPLRGRPCYATSATKQSGGSSASNAQTKCRRSR